MKICKPVWPGSIQSNVVRTHTGYIILLKKAEIVTYIYKVDKIFVPGCAAGEVRHRHRTCNRDP